MAAKCGSEICGGGLRARVLIALQSSGVRELARQMRMHPQTVLAIASSVPVRPGSLALAERYFRLLDEGPRTSGSAEPDKERTGGAGGP